MPTFTPPNTPLGRFVRENYKTPGLQRRVFTKLRREGFTPPSDGGARRGGLTDAQRRELPLTFLGRDDVLGGYARPPRLNPNDYEVRPNRYGRYFAVPRSELTGLSTEALGTIKAFDAETARTVPHLQQTFGQLRTTLQADADATTQRLGNLGSLIQGSQAQTDPGVANIDARLADARRGAETARSAVTVGQQSALPAYAEAEGARAVADYQAGRASDRTSLIAGFREQQAAAEAAQRELSAQLRGQDLQLLGTQLAQAGGIERALIQTGSSERETAAELENRLLIAEIEGRVSEANSIRSQLARIYAADTSAASRTAAAARSGGNQRQKDTAKFVQRVRGQLRGSVVRNPDYRSETATPNQPQFILKPTGVSPADIIRDAVTQGVKLPQVLQAIRAVIPGYGQLGAGPPAPNVPGASADRSDFSARAVYDTLVAAGVPAEQARKLTKQFTGVNFTRPR